MWIQIAELSKKTIGQSVFSSGSRHSNLCLFLFFIIIIFFNLFIYLFLGGGGQGRHEMRLNAKGTVGSFGG